MWVGSGGVKIGPMSVCGFGVFVCTVLDYMSVAVVLSRLFEQW